MNDTWVVPLPSVEEDTTVYFDGFSAAIDKVLEIIDKAIDEDDKSPISWTAACKAIRREVSALKEGAE